MPRSHGRALAAAVFLFALACSPYAHAAQTAAVPINDPFTDTLELWSDIATTLSSLAHDFASLFDGQQFVATNGPSNHLATSPALAAAAATSQSAQVSLATSSATTPHATSDQTTLSQNVKSADFASINPATSLLSDPTPAFDASNFVTQDQLTAQLNALTDALSAKFGQPATTTPPTVANASNRFNIGRRCASAGLSPPA